MIMATIRIPRVGELLPAFSGRQLGLIVMRFSASAAPVLLFSVGASALAAVVVLLRGYQIEAFAVTRCIRGGPSMSIRLPVRVRLLVASSTAEIHR